MRNRRRSGTWDAAVLFFFFFILIVGIKHHDSLFIAYLEHSLTKSDKDGVFPHLCLPVI